MKNDIRFVAMDTHAETITSSVSDRDGEVQRLGTIPNRHESVRRLIKKLGPVAKLRVCYEAGPTGYVLYWQLTEMGVHCDVVAPTLVPVKAGDRVKTDRRDADKLAVLYRGGQLTPVWVPDAEHEALRDLMRGREAAKQDQLRARHRLQKFLLRHGRRSPQGVKPWTQKHLNWVRREVRFEPPAQEAVLLDYLTEVDHARDRIARLEQAIDVAVQAAPERMRAVIEALQALRGIAKISAATIIAEVGTLSRFARPRHLMGYSGALPREHSSGGATRRGSITKTGNAHLRRSVVEAGWSYRHRPGIGGALRVRQKGLSEEVKAIAWKAQHRLHGRYRRLVGKGKLKQQVVTAIGRELLGFIWAIGVHVEKNLGAGTRRAA
ncbi:MAG: IS110 family transposase [Candidatus Rokuibacteriota bacterium]